MSPAELGPTLFMLLLVGVRSCLKSIQGQPPLLLNCLGAIPVCVCIEFLPFGDPLLTSIPPLVPFFSFFIWPEVAMQYSGGIERDIYANANIHTRSNWVFMTYLYTSLSFTLAPCRPMSGTKTTSASWRRWSTVRRRRRRHFSPRKAPAP